MLPTTQILAIIAIALHVNLLRVLSALIKRLFDAPFIGVSVSGGKDSLFVWNWAVSTFGADRVIALTIVK